MLASNVLYWIISLSMDINITNITKWTQCIKRSSLWTLEYAASTTECSSATAPIATCILPIIQYDMPLLPHVRRT